MVKVSKEDRGGITVIRLSGSIEESTNFDQLIGVTAGEVHVNTKEVPRINSVGVKAWIRYFQDLKAKGTRLKFVECSTAIVEQINLISNFTAGGTVENLFVPFSCKTCKSELVGLFKPQDIKKLSFELPDLKCTKCGGLASFDDIPDEYFGFLMRG